MAIPVADTSSTPGFSEASLDTASSVPSISTRVATEAEAEAGSSLHPQVLESLPSPPPSTVTSSAKLAALHARLALPPRLPVESLARALVDATADSDPRFNNASLAALGNDLLGYYMAEHLLCHYPRLPLEVVFAAQAAYVGPKALGTVAQEWGVEVAAEPGGEVDPGLLQFRRTPPGTVPTGFKGTRPDKSSKWRRGMSSRVVYDDAFGELQGAVTVAPTAHSAAATEVPNATLAVAATTFVRALFGAIYLHAGAAATQMFFSAHVLSRRLDMASLFVLAQPTRDLSRLCAREGFEAPVARILAESGRLSRHPVFVVGVYSGADKLGEGAGASLNEARFRAAAAALKGWYLYSPAGEIMVPSDVEGEQGQGKAFRPAVIDEGEIVA